jgi:hypothetical protein
MMRAIAAATLGLLMSSTATMAQEGTMETIPVNEAEEAESLSRPAQLPYTFAALRYMFNEYEVRSPATTVDGDGFAVDGSFQFLPSFFAVGSYSMVSTDEVPGTSATADIDELSLGGGYRMELAPAADFNATLQIVRQEVSGTGGSADEIGYRLGAGVRSVLFTHFEGRAEVSYFDIDEEGDLFLTFGGLYRIMPQLAAGLDMTLNNEVFSYGVTGRWAF